jgi:hypothetical protein
MSRSATVPNQSPVLRVPSTLGLGVKWPRHVLATHLHQVLMLRQSSAIYTSDQKETKHLIVRQPTQRPRCSYWAHLALGLTVREPADKVGISIGPCHQIFTQKLQMRRVSAKFVICRKACACAQFSARSSTTNAHGETGQMAVCWQNLTLGAPTSCSVLSVLVDMLFKKFGLFFEHSSTPIPPVGLHGFVYRLILYLFTCDENVYYHGNDGYTSALTWCDVMYHPD